MPTPWVTLSTTTGWPKRSVSLLPSVRATRSGLPPAAVGMMMRSGRTGQAPVWAAAGETAAMAAAYSSVLRVNDIRLSLPTAGLVVQEEAAGPTGAIVAHRRATVQPRRDRTRGRVTVGISGARCPPCAHGGGRPFFAPTARGAP